MTDAYQAIYEAVRSRISNGDVGSAVSEVARQAFDISQALNLLVSEFMQSTNEMRRPSVLLRVCVFKDGDQWCALYGENLQDGVCGFGATPEAAARDFDLAWEKP